MKHDIGVNNVIYVMNDEKLIYEVREYETYQDCNYIRWGLNLVAGRDYVDPDHSNQRGWVVASNFTEDVQYESFNQYVIHESLKECLEIWGFEIVPDELMTVDLIDIINTSKMSAES